jgi:hypothetical protein
MGKSAGAASGNSFGGVEVVQGAMLKKYKSIGRTGKSTGDDKKDEAATKGTRYWTRLRLCWRAPPLAGLNPLETGAADATGSSRFRSVFVFWFLAGRKRTSKQGLQSRRSWFCQVHRIVGGACDLVISNLGEGGGGNPCPLPFVLFWLIFFFLVMLFSLPLPLIILFYLTFCGVECLCFWLNFWRGGSAVVPNIHVLNGWGLSAGTRPGWLNLFTY